MGMLLMVQKGIRGGICHAIHRYEKVNNRLWKIIIKTKNHHIFSIWVKTICIDGQCLKMLLVNSFEWANDISSLNS